MDDGGNVKIVNNSDIRNIQNRSRADSVAVSDLSIAYEYDKHGIEIPFNQLVVSRKQ